MTKTETKISLIDKPIYRYWQAIYHSFFNPKLYVDVAKRWKGLGLRYLLLIIIIFSIPFALRLSIEINQVWMEKMLKPIMQLPTLFVQNGQISSDKPMPYLIKDEQNRVTAVIDTTGSTKTIDNKNYPEQTVLVTKDKVFLGTPLITKDTVLLQMLTTNSFAKKAEGSQENSLTIPLSEQVNAVFDEKEWDKAYKISNLKIFITVFIYLSIALIAFGCFLVYSLVLSLLAQFIAKLFFNLSLTYVQTCRLFIVSLTPYMLVFWTLMVLGHIFSPYAVLLPLIVFAYFCYAVIAVKRESHKLVRS